MYYYVLTLWRGADFQLKGPMSNKKAQAYAKQQLNESVDNSATILASRSHIELIGSKTPYVKVGPGKHYMDSEVKMYYPREL